MTYFVFASLPRLWEDRGHGFWLFISLGHDLVTGTSQEKGWLMGAGMSEEWVGGGWPDGGIDEWVGGGVGRGMGGWRGG